MIILTILTSIVITLQTYNQYKKITITANQKIAEIIGTIIKEAPEIDTRTIIKTLNSKQDNEEYQIGQEELKKYGININEANSIIAVRNQMIQNTILNNILIIVFSILWMAIIFLYLRKRDKKINQITQYINQIKNRKYDLDINENSEDHENFQGNGAAPFRRLVFDRLRQGGGAGDRAVRFGQRQESRDDFRAVRFGHDEPGCIHPRDG